MLRSEKSGDIGMIEYAPGHHAWRPVEAEGYLVIHCLWVYGQHKGKGLGSVLLKSCLEDAKKSECRGVAVVTSSESFMAGRDLFIKAGFVPVDRIPCVSCLGGTIYELLVKKLQKTVPDPRFVVARERLLKRYSKGLTILAADQCPYAAPNAGGRWMSAIRTSPAACIGERARCDGESESGSSAIPMAIGMATAGGKTPYGGSCSSAVAMSGP